MPLSAHPAPPLPRAGRSAFSFAPAPVRHPLEERDAWVLITAHVAQDRHPPSLIHWRRCKSLIHHPPDLIHVLPPSSPTTIGDDWFPAGFLWRSSVPAEVLRAVQHCWGSRNIFVAVATRCTIGSVTAHRRASARGVACYVSVTTSLCRGHRQSAMCCLNDLRMREDSVALNDFTYSTIMTATVASIPLQIQAQVIKTNYRYTPIVGTALLASYSKLCSTEEALSIFKMIDQKDVVAWSTMLTFYAQAGDCMVPQMYHQDHYAWLEAK